MKRKYIQIALSILIIVLTFLIYDSIMKPVRFNNEQSTRRAAVIERLKDIRSAQMIYKSIKGSYAPDFKTLIEFIKTASIPVVRMVPDPKDTTYTRAISDTVGYVNVADSLLGKKKGVKAEDLAIIPFSSSSEQFKMEAGEITKGNVKVSVFMVIAPKQAFLAGLNENMVESDNVKDLIVGSMTEPSTDGNWE